MSDFPWRALLGRVTAAEREHRRRSDELWQAHDVIGAVRDRGIADGLDQARTIHAQVIADHRAGAVETDPLASAMHSVWLHGDWRWLTKNMTAEEREASAAAVQAYSDRLHDDNEPLTDLRWWAA